MRVNHRVLDILVTQQLPKSAMSMPPQMTGATVLEDMNEPLTLRDARRFTDRLEDTVNLFTAQRAALLRHKQRLVSVVASHPIWTPIARASWADWDYPILALALVRLSYSAR